MSDDFPLVPLGDMLTQDTEYIEAPEPKIYPKLSVKLYGKGVVLDKPADGMSLKMQRHQIAKCGQVILSEIWGKKGAIGFVPPEGEGALCTSHFFLFDVRYDRLESAWLRAIFTANYLEEQLNAHAKGTTGYAAVRPKHLLAAHIPLPPLAEQRRIVARIEELAARIAEARGLRRQAIEEIATLLAASSRAVFSKTAQQSSVRPLKGTFTFRNDLIRPTDGKTGTLRFIGLQHVEPDTGRRIGEDIIQAETLDGRKFRFSPGEIVYGYLRPYLNKVWIADCDGLCSVDQYVLRPLPGIADTAYLAHYMRSPSFLEQAKALTNNLMLPRLRSSLLESIEISLPSIQEQRGIVQYLDKVQAKVDAVKRLQAETAAELDALLPAVLDRAFRGDL